MTAFGVVVSIAAMTAAALVAMVVMQRHRWSRINRRSRAVSAWAPGSGRELRVGDLAVRVAGDPAAPVATILLHGLGSSGLYFGADWDRLASPTRRMVVPDLLGFGDSLDRSRSAAQYSLEDHLTALRACVDEVVTSGARLVIGAHSMGCLVALGLADSLRERVDAVVLLGPPLHDSREEAERFVAQRGWFARYFTLDRRIAHATCRTVCTRPWLATPLARVVAPALPVALADRTMLLSWESYVGSLRALLGRGGWRDELARLQHAHVRVIACVGERDHTIDRMLLARLADEGLLELAERAAAGHQMPLTDGAWCADRVLNAVSASRRMA